MSRRWAAVPGVGLAALLVLTSCSPGDDGPEPTPTSSAGTVTPSGTPTDSPPPSGPDGGTPDAPAVVDPVNDPLAWEPTPGDVADTVTVGDGWVLTVAADGRRATLDGDRTSTVRAGGRFRITDALLSPAYAVVVASDRLEEQPARATVVDLATGAQTTLDGDSDIPTVNGGSWALGDGVVLHPTLGDDRAYCLGSSGLGGRPSDIVWCAPRRHGFTNVRVGPGGTSVMTFDDSRPSCRTVGRVADGDVTPFDGAPDCTGWDGVLLAGSRVWTVPTDESRVEEGRVFAAIGDAFYDLGSGRTGTLVACDGAAYFARDPARDGGAAQLLRWTDDGTLSVVYESEAGGESYVAGTPRCGGGRLTISVLSAQGDEQVSSATS